MDARQEPPVGSKQENLNSLWQWTPQTAKVMRKWYDGAMNPARCNVNYAYVKKPRWGLTSRLRDFEDILIPNVLKGRLVLHKGGRQCPSDADDPFLLCLFQPFSKCQGEVNTNQSSDQTPGLVGNMLQMDDTSTSERAGIVRDATVYNSESFSSAVQPLWHELLRNGLRNDRTSWAPASTFQQLGIIRALLSDMIQVTPMVQKRVAELERKLPSNHGPMLIIHIRRTDKMKDGGFYPDWYADKDVNTLLGIINLIRFAEKGSVQNSGLQYATAYIIADEPRFFNQKHIAVLKNAFKEPPLFLYNNYVADQETGLPSSLFRPADEAAMRADVELLADITFAAKYGTHIIGCGRSGISQLIAQKLGAKFMMDPNVLSLFEDDATLLRSLMGEEVAAKHLDFTTPSPEGK
jgi:hypothetical protein